MANNFDPHNVNEGKDKELDGIIRPQELQDFSGQDKIVTNLKIFVAAAKMRGEPLDHVLFHGPPGLGKTTLAHIIANELGVNMKITSGPILDKPGDLAGLLTSLEEGDVLFIDDSPAEIFLIFNGGVCITVQRLCSSSAADLIHVGNCFRCTSTLLIDGFCKT